ncbi:hypothetical protein M9H77_36764 [Catharanthus roseus]|uniref:Uncharacterized protein n=1 Tax=Catharanthus roseus TaxID=4058 RepID=A0ACB9ZUK5_CATRO|nr:hypothetical protein M9H77_36764 [Catharanthus roseus]
MDSKLLHGAPLSATMSAPKVTNVSSSTTGIRAPLTLDDDSDFEYSVSTSGQKDGNFSSSSSDNEFLSNGFDSGEEHEFDTASKRDFVSGLDSGILQETQFVKKYVVTRPLVKNPNEELIQESSNTRDSDDNMSVVEDNDNLAQDIDRRPSVTATSYGTARALAGEDKNASITESSVLDAGIAVLPRQGVPIAQLSWDSDDDFVGSDTSEDVSFLGVARVPDSGVEERLDYAPKVRVLEVVEVEDSSSQTENVSELEILEGSALASGNNEVMNSSNKESHLVLDEIDPESTSAEVIEGKDPLVTERSEFRDMDKGTKEPDPSNIIVGEMNYPNMLGVTGAKEVEHILPCEVRESEVMKMEAVEDFGTLDNEGSRSQIINAEETVVCSRSNEVEQLMDDIEPNEGDSHDCNSLNNTESVGGAMVLDVVESKNDAEINVAQRPECFENDHFPDITESLVMEDELPDESNISQALSQRSSLELETSIEIENDSIPYEEEEGSLKFDDTQSGDFGGSEIVNSADQLEEHISSDSLSCEETCQNHSQVTDMMTGTDLKNVPDTNRVLEEEEVSDSSEPNNNGVLEEEVSDSSEPNNNGVLEEEVSDSSEEQLTSRGSIIHSLGPSGESSAVLSEEERKKLERLQKIRVKFLRLVHRLKQSPEDTIAAKVLYQLLLASGEPSAQEFGFDFAKQAAMELEAEGTNNLDFSLNIFVIGKSGVGKSATINSIFREDKTATNAFEPATTGLNEVKGILDGVQVRILDTPGLRSSLMEQSANRKILLLIKKFMKKFPPDIILYVDRLDLQTRDLNDLPLLKSVSSYLGSSIWFRTILTLTHAASTPPEGPSGNALSYELFVAQQSHAVQQLICHSIGDLHILKPNLIPVSLVENHSKSEMDGSWRSKLLLLCYSMKILSETVSVVQRREISHPSRFFGLKAGDLPLPYFLSSLLQTNDHPKLFSTQGGQDVDSDFESAYSSNCDEESEDEYDRLPEFRPLRKSEIAELDKKLRKAYFEEYDYRVKLLQKKQLKEEMRRSRNIKKHRQGSKNLADIEEEMESPEAVAVPFQDVALPPSFDGDNPTYRYRALGTSSGNITRPILDTHGWDHDCGYDGVNIEDNLAIAGQFPIIISLELTKDKRKCNIHFNSSVSAKYGEKGSTMAGLNIQTTGKQLAYSLMAETKMKHFEVHKSAAGISISFLGGNVVTGLKVEDQMAVGKNLILVGTAGLSRCQNDAAVGANLAIHLKDKDYPIEEDEHLIGLSIMRWRGDNMLGLDMQSHFPLGRNTKLGVRAGLNSKRNGQVSVRISSSDYLHIATMGLLPILKTIINCLFA